jgi:amino acid adenylation domain-containing protein
MKLSTCLIGEDSLLIQCAEILLAKGHFISVIVSSIEKIQIWAKKKNILLVENVKQLSNLNEEFDYIFSIVNSSLLSDSVLQLARYAAINYHDSLLPKYAGLNATTWAILNNEKMHGITWHLMNNKIDKGDIIKQRHFPIEKSDTAFTLNLRCYELAIESFYDLINNLENENMKSRNQDLHNQTYYSSQHELPNYGFINWKSFDAEKIERLCKALTFGHYKNSVGSLKLHFQNFYLIVTKAEVSEVNLKQKTNPGTVLLLDEEAIWVSTTSKPIKITALISPLGIKIKLNELIEKKYIYIGYQFEEIKENDISFVREFYSHALRNEQFWIKDFLEATEHSIFSEKEIGHLDQENIKNHEINVKNIYPNKKIESVRNMLIAAILIYLYRINNHENVNIFFLHNDFSVFHNKCLNLFSYLLPFNFSAPINCSLSDILKLVNENISNISKNTMPLTDIIARNPELEGKVLEPNIVISFIDELRDFVLPQKTIFHFHVNEKNSTIQINHRFKLSLQSRFREIFSNISQHITNILISLINHSHLSITTFSFLAEHERYKLLHNFGTGKTKILPRLSISSLFEKQAKFFPHKIAILINQENFTYSQLLEASEKLADFIAQKCIPEQTLIGVFLSRSMEMFAVILGILKANCTYVPLDIQYPLSRIESILSDANIKTLFIQEKLSTKLESLLNNKGSQINVYVTEKILESNLDISNRNNATNNDCLETLTYVMYTSGTTGTPKGVMVTQQNILNYCFWFLDTTHFNYSSIIDFSSSFAFDLSVPCMIAPLLVGGSVSICEEKTKSNPKQYLLYLKNSCVTHIEMTPGYLNLLLNFPEEIKQLKDLKCLLLGADAVSKTDVVKWHELCPWHQLINEYGPTETTVAVSSYFIDPDELPDESLVPVGRPAYNTQCYILDKHKNLCPIGMSGELYIGGAQLSKGYLNKSELTKNKFINHNIYKHNEILYQTGDVAYWLSNGNLQFLGRNDLQVKVQGYRIEISEIESVLSKIPGINQVIVVLQEGKFKEKYLRAYLKCDKNFIYDDEIRKILASSLPNYMIPREFCIIDFTPLKENEKIDYDELKKKKYRLLTSISTKNLKVDLNLQTTILQIWQNFFNSKSITEHDNFFDIGGDSSMALQIIYEVENRYNINIQVKYLFEYPTVAKLANKVRKLLEFKIKDKPNSISKDAIIQLSQGTHKIPVFLVHPVGGTIFWYKRLASLLQGKYTIYGIQDPSIDNEKIKFESLEDMACYYIKQTKKIYSGNHYYLGGASFGSNVAFEMANQLTKSGKVIKFLGLFDGWATYPDQILQNHTLDLLTSPPPSNLKLSAERKKILKDLEHYRKTLLTNYKLPFLDQDVILFKAMELWPSFISIEDKFNRWKPYIGGQIVFYKVPGNHETIFFDPHVQSLAKSIEQHFAYRYETKNRVANENIIC